MEEELEKREKKMPVWDPQRETEARRHYRKGLLAGVGYTLLILASMAAGILWARQDIAKKKGIYRPGAGILTQEFMDEVCRVYAQIDQTFLYDYDIKKMQDGMLEGMLDALGDPYSVYYNESALESFTTQTEGEYYGIGCMVSQDKLTGVVTIVKPYANSPAMEAGILPGDILCAVNGTEITGMDLDQVVTMIKGAEGTTVRLSLEREGKDRLQVDVERRQVEVNTVEHEMLEGEIGYIAVSSFDGVTPAQFKAAFEELKQQGMKGLVIDMRSNGGGLLSAVEEMLDYMLPEGVIFYAKDKKGNTYLEYTSDESFDQWQHGKRRRGFQRKRAGLRRGNAGGNDDLWQGDHAEYLYHQFSGNQGDQADGGGLLYPFRAQYPWNRTGAGCGGGTGRKPFGQGRRGKRGRQSIAGGDSHGAGAASVGSPGRETPAKKRENRTWRHGKFFIYCR